MPLLSGGTLLVLSIAGLMLPAVWGVKKICSEENIMQCLEPLKPYGLIKDNQEDQVYIPMHNRTTWQTICRLQEISYKCVDELVNCITSHELELTAISNADEYLCNEGFEGFYRNQNCLQTKSLLRDANRCTKIYTNHIDYVNPNHADVNSLICQYMESYITCLHDVVLRVCGQEAATFEKEYDKRLLQPTGNLINCQLFARPMSMGVIVGIVLACAVVVLIVLIVFLHLRKVSRRKSRHRRRGNRPQSRGHVAQVPVIGYEGATGGPGVFMNQAYDKPPLGLVVPPAYEENPPPYEGHVKTPPPVGETIYDNIAGEIGNTPQYDSVYQDAHDAAQGRSSESQAPQEFNTVPPSGDTYEQLQKY